MVTKTEFCSPLVSSLRDMELSSRNPPGAVILTVMKRKTKRANLFEAVHSTKGFLVFGLADRAVRPIGA
jgi:hypothetical protein